MTLDILTLANHAIFLGGLVTVIVFILRAERRITRLEGHLISIHQFVNSVHDDVKTIKDELLKQALRG